MARAIRKQSGEVRERWERLKGHVGGWQSQVERALERLQELQSSMDQLDLRLTRAEEAKATWQPVGDLLIDSLQDHIDRTTVSQRVRFLLMHHNHPSYTVRYAQFECCLTNLVVFCYKIFENPDLKKEEEMFDASHGFPGSLFTLCVCVFFFKESATSFEDIFSIVLFVYTSYLRMSRFAKENWLRNKQQI